MLCLLTQGVFEISLKERHVFLHCKHSNSDIILLQEKHSCESDMKFWKSQWGHSLYPSHGSNHSAGVMTLLHKFKGDVLVNSASLDGRWTLMVVKSDNSTFIIGNIYGHNSYSLNRGLFDLIANKVKSLQTKYPGSFTILAGDYNVAPNDAVDRYPAKLTHGSLNNIISSLCTDLSLMDSWRFFNPNTKEYTWYNKSHSLKSRIDLFLISAPLLQYVKNVSHEYAPLSDHKLVSLNLECFSTGSRGY